ncbi:TPA: hypothetical protein ACYLDV_002972, partial [Shigella dysenteriae]
TGGTADRNRSHWSTSKTPSYTKSVSWQHHRDPENMTAKASLSPKDTLCVSFFIGDEAIFTLKLQLKENTRSGCIDLSNAYFNGVVICGIDCLEVDLSNAETNNSRWYD